MSPILLSSSIQKSARTLQIEGMFGMSPSMTSTVTLPDFPKHRLEERDWSIGLIVGASGCGKTQTAKAAFFDYWPEEHDWSHDKAIIDEISKDASVKEIVEVMSSVGFSSPPSWLRPYHVLSNGEKFRSDIARLILSSPDTFIVDEFSSVVDRTVAQITSYAVQKVVRKRKQRFIAVTCHYDVKDWLMPDWVYTPENGDFRWECLHRRPTIDFKLVRGSASDWRTFSRHHYLDAKLNGSARSILGLVDETPVAFCAVLPMPSGTIQNAWRISRVVTVPDYQGVGIGNVITCQVGAGMKALGKTCFITTSHPGMIASLNRSSVWSLSRKPSRSARDTKGISGTSHDRNTAGFRYVGPESKEVGALLAGGALRLN